jgi:hypothetical protein
VRSYRILRAADDSDQVMIDLEFDRREEAEAFQGRLRELWGDLDTVRDPEARLVEVAETGDY